jgi:hypothetical protein
VYRLGEWAQVEADDGFLQPVLRGGDDGFCFVSHSVLFYQGVQKRRERLQS